MLQNISIVRTGSASSGVSKIQIWSLSYPSHFVFYEVLSLVMSISSLVRSETCEDSQDKITQINPSRANLVNLFIITSIHPIYQTYHKWPIGFQSE